MQEMRAISRRALGKDGDVVALGENPGNLLVDDPSMATAATAQEDRIAARRQPADQRPVPDFLLGDKGGRQGGIDDKDIEPRNMVGDNQRARHGMAEVSLEFDAQRGQDTPGDTRFNALVLGIGAPGNQEKDEKNNPAQRQREAKQPESA
jgi:hypothetical protein